MPKTPTSTTRKPRNSINSKLILDAAERLMATSGNELSIREIAGELGASPMSLYRHFPNKGALLDAILDRVLSRFSFAETHSDWIIDLQEFAIAHKQLLDNHPWALQFLFSHPSPGVGATRIGEVAFSILQRGGVTGVRAVSVFSGIIALNYGWASFVSAQKQSLEGDENGPGMDDATKTFVREEFPLTHSLMGDLARYGDQKHYLLVISHFCSALSSMTAGA